MYDFHYGVSLHMDVVLGFVSLALLLHIELVVVPRIECLNVLLHLLI